MTTAWVCEWMAAGEICLWPVPFFFSLSLWRFTGSRTKKGEDTETGPASEGFTNTLTDFIPFQCHLLLLNATLRVLSSGCLWHLELITATENQCFLPQSKWHLRDGLNVRWGKAVFENVINTFCILNPAFNGEKPQCQLKLLQDDSPQLCYLSDQQDPWAL